MTSQEYVIAGIVIVLVVLIVVGFVGIDKMGYSQEMTVLLNDPYAAKSTTTTNPITGTTTTTLPCCSVNWKIPKHLQEQGGWNSIRGWWEDESPYRWQQDWEKVY